MPADVHDRVVSNLAQLVAPAAAGGTVLRRARRAEGRLRVTWGAFGAACASWAAGQAWWASQEMTGAGIPFVMKKLGFDPAQSATIFATTVTDVCGFLALLGLAALMLR